MSQESKAIFYAALDNYRQAHEVDPDANPTALRAAAWGHTGASRPLQQVIDEYETAMAVAFSTGSLEKHADAQVIADELFSIRMATEIAAGNLPFRAPTVTAG